MDSAGHCPRVSFPDTNCVLVSPPPPGLTSPHTSPANNNVRAHRTPAVDAKCWTGRDRRVCVHCPNLLCSMRTTQCSLSAPLAPPHPAGSSRAMVAPCSCGARVACGSRCQATWVVAPGGCALPCLPKRLACCPSLHTCKLSLCPPALRLFEGNLSPALGNMDMRHQPQPKQQQGGLFGGQRTAGGAGKQTLGGGSGGLGGGGGFGSGLAGNRNPFGRTSKSPKPHTLTSARARALLTAIYPPMRSRISQPVRQRHALHKACSAPCSKGVAAG